MPATTSPTRHVCVAAADAAMAVLPVRDGPAAWPLPGSLLFHALLIGLVVAMPQKRWVRPPQEKVLVQIVTPQQFNAATTTDSPSEPQSPQPVLASPSPDRFGTLPVTIPVPARPAPPPPTRMIRVTKILSAEALDDPRSRQARAALRTLSDFDRREQLCNLEAMEQVHAWNDDYEPERLVAYAMADTRISGNVVLAEGAAFRSKRRWYNLKYRCEVTSDLVAVTAFEFQVGDPVPREDWEAYYLPERY